ncbi:MAG: AAA family ATPase [Nitrospiraceae bacterium]
MIAHLIVERFKRIEAVEIDSDGQPLILITGKNEQGKSSVLDAIEFALGGRRHEPGEAVRRGEKDTRVVVVTDKYRVEKKQTAAGKSQLVVTSIDGRKKYATPQALLDELYGDISFDPLAFARAKSADQAEMLRKVAGLDLTEIDAKIKAAYDSRTEINRDAHKLEAQIEAMPDVDAPAQEIDVSSLAQELVRVGNLGSRYMRNVDNLKGAEERVVETKAAFMSAVARRDEAKKTLECEGKPAANAVEEIQSQINEANSTNERVRLHLAKHAKVVELNGCRAEWGGYTDRIEALRADRKLMIEAADMPLEGLGFDDDGLITYKGMLFKQASQSEEIRVSTAIGIKANPGKLILSRDGSLLDDDHLRIFSDMVKEAGAQVFIEKVTDGEATVGAGVVGIVIQDGNVVEKNMEVPA